MKTQRLAVRLVRAALLAGTFFAAGTLRADEKPRAEEPRFGPYFIGHETEPAMDYGGRVMISLHRAASDAAALPTRRLRYLTPAYELPFAILISTLQHEIHGHGARGREFGLKPSYGFGLDFSAYTTIARDPASLEQLAALTAGGTEADSVMAHRILIDFCGPDPAPASDAMLLLLAKLDLSVYVLATAQPRADRERRADEDDSATFTEQYEQGNDIAIYLATRQAARRRADAGAVWRRDYALDFDDPLLDRNYRQARDAALWNALDPMLWASVYLYVRHHVVDGQRFMPRPALPLNNRYAMGLGTRATIEPQSVSRFLDLYLLTPRGVLSLYARDLRASEKTAYGFGGGAHRMALGPRTRLSLAGDYWQHPEASENLYDGAGWNVAGEIEFPAGPFLRVGLKLGWKNEGYFPGAPLTDGAYAGGGLIGSF
jgi:hypothetical protein